MKESAFSTLIISSLSLLLYFAVRVCYNIWWRPKSLEKHLKQQGIKGTPYKLLYGDMKDYMRFITEAWSKPMNQTHQITPRVVPFVKNLVQSHGKISLMWTGTTPRLIISDTQLIKEIIFDKFDYFQKPPVNSLILILSRGLTTLEGEKWAQHRRIINPAFHIEKLKGMIPEFSTSCSMLIERWKKMANPKGSCELDVWPEFEKLTGDIISRAAFGSNYEEGKRMFKLQKEQMILVVEAMQTLYIPGFRFIPTKKNQRRKYLDKEIKSILRDFINRKEQAMRSGQSSGDDLLGLLLQSVNQNRFQDNVSNTKSNGMTIEEVIEECKLFYLAGQETTSSLLTWAMIVLAMHTSWQEKAREEIYQLCGKKAPDFEDINHLKIVTMILYEVLRLYPPVVEIYRHTHKRIKVGEISLPKGVGILLPILLTHHDVEFWGEDAEEFKPDRFADGVSKATKNELAFFPFGWGPKTCIGQNFAMIEARMVLAMILQNFAFELSPSYTHAPYTVMTLQPQHGAQIILHQL